MRGARVCRSRHCGVFAFVTLWVSVASPSSVTLCLPCRGSCMGACILGASLNLEACECDSCLWCDLGFTVTCVWLWGYFCSCPLGSPMLPQCPLLACPQQGWGRGHPPKGGFWVCSPCAPRPGCMSSHPPWPTCLPPADLVQGEPLECGGWGGGGSWMGGGGGVCQTLKITPSPAQPFQRSFNSSHRPGLMPHRCPSQSSRHPPRSPCLELGASVPPYHRH